MTVKGAACAVVLTIGLSGLSWPASADPDLYCYSVMGEVEGFGQNYTRSTSERSRDEAIAEQKTRWAEMRREIASIEPQETECEAVYPIGLEEWHCIARAEICVKR